MSEQQPITFGEGIEHRVLLVCRDSRELLPRLMATQWSYKHLDEATDSDLRAAGYVPMGEIVNFDDFVALAKQNDTLRAQVLKALLPSAEELAQQIHETHSRERGYPVTPWAKLAPLYRQGLLNEALEMLRELTGGEER